MKYLFTWLLIGFSFGLTANDGMDSVVLNIKLEENIIHVRETIFLTITDSGDDFRLRALPSEDSQVFIDTIHVDQRRISYELLDITPTLNFRFQVVPENKIIDIYYTLSEIGEEITVPIFFTSLSALNSETDFFTASIFRTMDQHFNLIFPKVPVKEIENGMHKTTSFRLPAVPSLIRLRKVNSNEVGDSMQWVDWMVGLVFMVIGIVLWFNRKKLSYG